jgi:hypothetical protein
MDFLLFKRLELKINALPAVKFLYLYIARYTYTHWESGYCDIKDWTLYHELILKKNSHRTNYSRRDRHT